MIKTYFRQNNISLNSFSTQVTRKHLLVSWMCSMTSVTSSIQASCILLIQAVKQYMSLVIPLQPAEVDTGFIVKCNFQIRILYMPLNDKIFLKTLTFKTKSYDTDIFKCCPSASYDYLPDHHHLLIMLLSATCCQNQLISLHSFLSSQHHLIICDQVPQKSTFQALLLTYTKLQDDYLEQ